MKPPNETADRGRGSDPGFDEEALYLVVRKAVKDALIDVIGTVACLGFALLFVWAGAQIVLSQGVSGAALGTGVPLILLGFYGAAVALEVVPERLDPL